ncbi:MAG: fluoride exporter [Actinomycetota bacterium]|nr:fluoride exporter [Actinomycetota bacterium]
MSAVGWIGLVVAGAVGAPARYLLDGWVRDRTGGDRPWGTFAVNASGSLILGVVAGLALYHGLPETSRVVLGTGFCGAYTTFSTFTFATVTLVEDGLTAAAVVNALGTLLVCAGAAAAGLALAGL